MKLLHRTLLRTLPAPFFAALGTLVFLLVMQFLIRYARDLIGKGLPGTVVLELLFYNTAYIVTLAVPMAVFVAVLVAFVRFSETQAYVAAQAAGVSTLRAAWPVVALAALVGGGLAYFGNVVLPEANFRARGLWQDIQRKQPGFALEPGVFFTRLRGYAILAQRIPRASRLEDLLVLDYTKGEEGRVFIKAAAGELRPLPGDRLALVLEDGSVEREVPGGAGRTERVRFERLRLRLDLSGFRFERSDDSTGYRTDRTTPTREMLASVDSSHALVARERARLAVDARPLLAGPPPADTAAVAADTAVAVDAGRDRAVADALAPPAARPAGPPRPDDPLAGLDRATRAAVADAARTRALRRRSDAETHASTADWERRRRDRTLVEVHKKQSIAAACVVFALMGIVLGLSVRRRRGGLARAGSLALAIFLVYWVTLVLGEKLTDRGLGPPWFGQWIANVLIGVTAAFFLLGGRLPSFRRGSRRAYSERKDTPIATA